MLKSYRSTYICTYYKKTAWSEYRPVIIIEEIIDPDRRRSPPSSSSTYRVPLPLKSSGFPPISLATGTTRVAIDVALAPSTPAAYSDIAYRCTRPPPSSSSTYTQPPPPLSVASLKMDT